MRALTFHPSMLVGLTAAAVVFASSSLSAQTGYPTTGDARLQYVPPQPTLEELQLEYDSIHIWAPAVGIPVSYLTMGFGMVTTIVGAAEFNFCFTDAPCNFVKEPRTTGERALIGVGSVVMISGLAGFVASIVRLRQKNYRRRKLRWQMEAIRDAE